MSRLHLYLTFNGNCHEAMLFYQRCLGGKLQCQTIGDSPMAAKMPEPLKTQMLHASLENEQIVLLGSDMVGKDGLLYVNTVSLALMCKSEARLTQCFQHLIAGGGFITHPIETTFWGALFGELTDKFGNRWILHFKQ